MEQLTAIKMEKYTFIFLLLQIIQFIAASRIQRAPYQSIDTSKVTAWYAPFMAAIYFNDTRSCSGALVHEQVIITTEKCCSLSTPTYTRIRVGTTDSRYGRIVSVTNWRTYNKYKICLMILNEQLLLTSNLATVELPNAKLPNSAPFFVYSWSQNTASYQLIRVPLYHLEKKQCEKKFKLKLHNYETCAGGSLNFTKFICGIEIGAPLIVGDILYGLASWNLDCQSDKNEQPLVILDIFKDRNFIKDFIKKNVAANTTISKKT